jgi:hypothetical protein
MILARKELVLVGIALQLTLNTSCMKSDESSSTTSDAAADLDAAGSNTPKADAKATGCGNHQVYAPSTCPQSCAAPCTCVQLISDYLPGSYPQVCSVPCAHPWDCPSKERCGYLYMQINFDGGSKTPICIPETIVTPNSAFPSGSIKAGCPKWPTPANRCIGNTLVQEQIVNLRGNVSGCTIAYILQEHCASGCTSSGGTARCSPSDASVSFTDGGTSPVCCPVAGGAYSCFAVGGAKVPPKGCEMACCEGEECSSFALETDPFGCKLWTKRPREAGASQ